MDEKIFLFLTWLILIFFTLVFFYQLARLLFVTRTVPDTNTMLETWQVVVLIYACIVLACVVAVGLIFCVCGLCQFCASYSKPKKPIDL
ncbi:hypothetical protein QR680_006133 [Steinernema hermaphroditum]|uniref:Uncharacterized protein n=1 Tax=Steinernema hermaphroditum TaxID=289476 RepID=A0AA39HUF1_9BILA|nr:hypothetical protein QR680_006133 [Steinernema hermaphroditum]